MQFLYSNNGHNYYAEQETGISVFYINISPKFSKILISRKWILLLSNVSKSII